MAAVAAQSARTEALKATPEVASIGGDGLLGTLLIYDIVKLVAEMPRNIYVGLYILLLIAVVVSVDLLFFRNRVWERLAVNIGIVLVFVAFFFRFLKNP